MFAHARAANEGELRAILDAEALAELPLEELDAAEVRAARERLFKGFGSCSWREPVDDLRALGWLE